MSTYPTSDATTVAETGPPTGLSWSRTVDRRLVHRDALAEVLLTDVQRIDSTRFAVAAQWPRSHRVYRPDATGRPDPMLVLETVRQVGLAVSHLGFAVPADHQALMADIEFAFDTDPGLGWPQHAVGVSIAVECVDIRSRHDLVNHLTVRLRCFVQGRRVATGSGTVNWLPAARYQALRRRTRPPRVVRPSDQPLPAASRYRSGSDSLIAAPDADFPRRRLLVPLEHPVYFDHPLDHVPGLLLIDAAWQAASQLLDADRRLIGADLRCPWFTELFPIALISLRPTEPDQLAFAIEQSGRITSSGLLRLTSA